MVSRYVVLQIHGDEATHKTHDAFAAHRGLRIARISRNEVARKECIAFRNGPPPTLMTSGLPFAKLGLHRSARVVLTMLC